MKRTFKIIVLFFSIRLLYSAANDAAVVFLTIFPGARAVGMGAAFTAVADDATSTFYNPGATPFFNHTEVTLQHSNWLIGLWPDMYYEFFGFIKPIKNLGTLGGHIIYLTTGETYVFDETGQEIATFVNFDFAIALNYGYRISEKMGAGINAKFIYSFLAPDWLVKRFFPESGGGGTGITYAFDLGLLYKEKLEERKILPGFNFGISLLNIGPGIKYTKQGGSEDPLPTTLKIGFAFPLYKTEAHRLLLSTEITKITVRMFKNWREQGFEYVWWEAWKHIGVEYVFYDFLSARIGYFHDAEGYRKGVMFGGGIKLRKFVFDIGVDSPIYDFPTDNYRFSLGYIF